MKNKFPKQMKKEALFPCFFFLLLFCSPSDAQHAESVTIIDSRHYSNVFGEIRNYRIFLPSGYFDNPQKKYPVIYFLHGWSQRYFGDGGQKFDEFDKGDDNKGDNIANFVSTHEVIVVKSDGYNRGPDEKYNLRPYNIDPVETFRQFPIYYPELIDYIDTHYHTVADREHRAISGLSMGGFMAFWIGGKYPHLFSGAGNFCGSAEFIVGPKNFPVEYRHIDMFLPFVNLTITTPALYEKNQTYVINDVENNRLKVFSKTIRSDNSGRLEISMNGNSHEIGINKKDDKANICIAAVDIGNMSWATNGKDVSLSIKILNKGMSTGKNIRAKLSATRKSANVIQSRSEFGSIGMNEIKTSHNPFSFHVQADSIEIEKFKLTIQDENNNEWVDFFEIPVKKNLPEIKDFEIADGKIFTVAKGGVDNETVLLGKGNGDGIANPGESVVLLVKDQNKYWRTDLYCSDQFVNPFGIHIRQSDNWDDFDHVGASAKYDVPLIASNCPENHSIEFFAEYWLPDYPLHIIKQGVIKIKVKGRDATPPQISWMDIPGDNIIRVKVYDGSKIQSVKAKFIPKDDPAKSFEVELKDDGLAEDRVEEDKVFCKKIPEQKFGYYRVLVEAIDSFGNKIIEEAPKEFLLH